MGSPRENRIDWVLLIAMYELTGGSTEVVVHEDDVHKKADELCKLTDAELEEHRKALIKKKKSLKQVI